MHKFYAKKTSNVCDNMEYFLTWAVYLATYLVCVRMYWAMRIVHVQELECMVRVFNYFEPLYVSHV